MTTIFNAADKVADECVDGFVASNPHVRKLAGHRIVVREDIEQYKKDHVTIVSGGGSGHEPAHAGFVGGGMLSAAVAGDVFASPPTGSILAAIQTVGGPKGVLLIIKNYTGDRLNFGLAAEQAKTLGINVKMVVVGEDCAVPKSKRSAGRRGLCGTVFVHKIAGALAEQGEPLATVYESALTASKNMVTMGASLSPCVVPGRDPSFEIAKGHIELGLGIHGEAGIQCVPSMSADKLAAVLVDKMLSTEPGHDFFSAAPGDSVALIVNNLGGTSNLELGIMCRSAIRYLVDTRQLKVDRVFAGSLMTSISMAGVSLTLLHIDDSTSPLLDAQTVAPGWIRSSVALTCGSTVRVDTDDIPAPPSIQAAFSGAPAVSDATGAVIAKCLEAIANTIITNEPTITEMDKICGDGDCGHTLKAGAEFILNQLTEKNLPLTIPAAFLTIFSTKMSDAMGGSSGALYAILLSAAAAHLRQPSSDLTSPTTWVDAFSKGVTAIQEYGGAKEGDRTMLDALIPACEYLKSHIAAGAGALTIAAERAEAGAENTKAMEAAAGRASYIDPSVIQGTPDPGAKAAALWITALAAALN